MNVEEALSFWDQHHERIKARYATLLCAACEGCRGVLETPTLDPLPMIKAWSAIEQRIHELEHRTGETWGDKVRPALEAAHWGEARIAQREYVIKMALNAMRMEKERLEIELFAEAARGIHERVGAMLAKDAVCTHCGVRLDVPAHFFRVTQLSCKYCDKVTRLLAHGHARSVEDFCVHHLSKACAQARWLEWLECEAAMREHAGADTTRRAEEALLAFYEAYLKARIALVPEYATTYEQDLTARMSGFYKSFEVRRCREQACYRA